MTRSRLYVRLLTMADTNQVTLAAFTAAFAAEYNVKARYTALDDPRAMNAWAKAKKALTELQSAAKVIDEVAGRG